MSISLTELNTLAEAASPSPWRLDTRYYHDVRDANSNTLFSGDDDGSGWPSRKEDAAFIAACDPNTVRALVEVARAAEAMSEAATGRCHDDQGMWNALVGLDRALAVFAGKGAGA